LHPYVTETNSNKTNIVTQKYNTFYDTKMFLVFSVRAVALELMAALGPLVLYRSQDNPNETRTLENNDTVDDYKCDRESCNNIRCSSCQL